MLNKNDIINVKTDDISLDEILVSIIGLVLFKRKED